jgi:hypothetical protein
VFSVDCAAAAAGDLDYSALLGRLGALSVVRLAAGTERDRERERDDDGGG